MDSAQAVDCLQLRGCVKRNARLFAPTWIIGVEVGRATQHSSETRRETTEKGTALVSGQDKEPAQRWVMDGCGCWCQVGDEK